ncbi:TPA: hypothetical protein N0F65_009993 [Lagenidium giganteum]|uniref:Pirin C-terminal domain-containing protein n=1 Tax=Lagenidium giganteum TaxID=4803 RepID=A0AAV2ZGL5_9STRA|nr:TPA: hypothetical protein N0F65_009993 [Lagenidium giganteum]
MDSRYQEVKRDQVPHAFSADGAIEAIVFAGDVFGVPDSIKTEAPVTYVHYTLQPELSATTRGCGTGSAGPRVSLQASGMSDAAVEFIVISGEPLREPVVQHGPFVMISEEGICDTIYDFQSGQNGFEHAWLWRPKSGKLA